VFGAESNINFEAVDSKDAPHFGVAAVDEALRSLPGGLQIAVKLRNRITGDLAVGALIDGEVSHPVTRRGNAPIVVGSPVHGRIRRLERYTEPAAYFTVALEFTEIEIEGIRHRFYADIVEIDPAYQVEKTLSFPGTTESRSLDLAGAQLRLRSWDTVTTHDLPGVATFFIRGSRLDLRPGFRTLWRTRPLAP
jgi:hypothetical protein